MNIHFPPKWIMFTKHAKDRIRERFREMTIWEFDAFLSKIANKVYSFDFVICKYDDIDETWTIELEINFPFRLAIKTEKGKFVVKTVFITKKERRRQAEKYLEINKKREAERYRIIKLEKH